MVVSMGPLLKHPSGTHRSAAVSREGNSDHPLWVLDEGRDGLKTDGCRKMRGDLPKTVQNSTFLFGCGGSLWWAKVWLPTGSFADWGGCCLQGRSFIWGGENVGLVWDFMYSVWFFSSNSFSFFSFPLYYLPLLKLKGLRNSCCCPWNGEHFY